MGHSVHIAYPCPPQPSVLRSRGEFSRYSCQSLMKRLRAPMSPVPPVTLHTDILAFTLMSSNGFTFRAAGIRRLPHAASFDIFSRFVKPAVFSRKQHILSRRNLHDKNSNFTPSEFLFSLLPQLFFFPACFKVCRIVSPPNIFDL